MRFIDEQSAHEGHQIEIIGIELQQFIEYGLCMVVEMVDEIGIERLGVK